MYVLFIMLCIWKSDPPVICILHMYDMYGHFLSNDDPINITLSLCVTQVCRESTYKISPPYITSFWMSLHTYTYNDVSFI